MWFNKGSILAVLVYGLCASSIAFAQEESEEAPEGLLPIPEYDEDIWKREFLSGDWGGTRTKWADSGVQLDMEWMQWLGSVTDGGVTDDVEYGGKLTFNMEVDLLRIGLPMAILQVRTESRYCCSTTFNTGTVAANNTAAIVPVHYNSLDGTEAIDLTNLSYTQFLSPKFGFTIGKIDLFANGDGNEFATGRGMTQFMNWNMNFPAQALILPGSTVGGGLIFLPSHKLSIVTLLVGAADCSGGDCFDDLDDKGKLSATSVSYQYRLGGKPGGFTAGFLYFFDKDFTDIDSISPLPGTGTTEDSAWQASVSFWQYLSVKETSEGPLDLLNRKADLQGWGLFGRISFGDEDSNLFETSATIGIGGRGIFSSRPDDEFGAGYFYNDINLPRFIATLGVQDSTQGVEAYYNWAITPGIRFTFDVQWLESALQSFDDSTVVHGRLLMTF